MDSVRELGCDARCILCLDKVVGSDTSSNVLVVVRKEKMIPLASCQLVPTMFASGYALHTDCKAYLANLLKPRLRHREMFHLLLEVVGWREFLWPVTREREADECLKEARQAMSTMIQIANVGTEVSEEVASFVERLQALPPEIQRLICDATPFCSALHVFTLRTSAIRLGSFLARPAGLNERSFVLRNVASLSCGRSTHHKYVATLKSRENAPLVPPLVACFDDMACTAVSKLNEQRSQLDARGDWFRFLSRSDCDALVVRAEGNRIKSIISEVNFQSSYLWDTVAPPELYNRHSYRLPTRLDLQRTLEHPVRLRYTVITTAARGLAVAYNSLGRIIGIEAHHSSCPSLYSRIESTFSKRAITWLYWPLSPSEAITEIVIRGLREPDNTGISCSSLEFQTSKNRRWSCGPYKPKSTRDNFQRLELVGDATLEVEGICLNEFSRYDAEPRIGISCRPRTSDCASKPGKIRPAEDPLSMRPPKLKRTRFWWFSHVDVAQQCSMQICFAPDAPPSACCGLLFRNPDGIHTCVGQWRIDGTMKIIQAGQFSTFALVNQIIDGKHAVVLSSHPGVTATAHSEVEIKGRLEWWAGSGGNYVAGFDSKGE